MWVDLGVVSLSYRASILWLLGYPDQAREEIHRALTLAKELSHPFSVAWSMYYAAKVHQDRRERQAAQERATALIALSIEQELPYWKAFGTILQGWALAGQGGGEEGIVQVRHSLAVRRAMGARIVEPIFLARLAEAYGKVGQEEEGLHLLAEALAIVDRTGQHVHEPELYRLKGELLLAQARKLSD